MSLPFNLQLSPSRFGAWALTGLVASIFACGGSVAVEQSQGAMSSSTGTGTGPVTGAGASTTTAGNGGSSTGDTGVGGSTGNGVPFDGGPGTCSPVLAPEQMMEMGCFQGTFCPQSTDAMTREQLTNALGFCNQEKIPCCEKTVIDQVACGPVQQGPNCCYVVVYSTFQCGE